ncbi:unnamed protein product [Sphagnum jensenii]|uniref:Secreted protein n=1 Tax=Sphagnum jensenii TaxID=128206 RepID=A0ABP0XF63_9BRYO
MASAMYKWRIARAAMVINTCNACSARETIAICVLLTQDLLCSVKEPQLEDEHFLELSQLPCVNCTSTTVCSRKQITNQLLIDRVLRVPFVAAAVPCGKLKSH